MTEDMRMKLIVLLGIAFVILFTIAVIDAGGVW